MERLIYKQNTADFIAILTHLDKCKNDFFPPLDQTVDLKDYSKKIARNAEQFECWADNELIGLIAAYFNNHEERIVFITNVSVAKEYKGLGIASYLMSNCINYARKKKFCKIELEVNKYAEAAVKLYNKYGFKQEHEKNDIYKMGFNLIKMQL